MNTTSIELLGLTVHEPFTWITNWCVGSASLYFGHILYYDSNSNKEMKLWSLFFFFMGITSFTGGIAHGFILYVGKNFHYAAWVFSGIAVYWAQRASIKIIKDSRLYNLLFWFILLEVITMTIAVIFFQSFEAVRVNSAFGLIGIVLPIQLYQYRMLGLKQGGIIALGILSNIFPAIIHGMRFSYNKWFNFNDISHVVMIGCFYLMYRGAKLIAIKQPVVNN